MPLGHLLVTSSPLRSTSADRRAYTAGPGRTDLWLAAAPARTLATLVPDAAAAAAAAAAAGWMDAWKSDALLLLLLLLLQP